MHHTCTSSDNKVPLRNCDSRSAQVEVNVPMASSGGKDSLTLIQFLYVEFFGAFVPGVVAVGTVSAILAHAARFYGILNDSLIKTTITWGTQPYGFAFFLFIAYAVGAIIYRRPHSTPDMASISRTWFPAPPSRRRKMAFSLGLESGKRPFLIEKFSKFCYSVRNFKIIGFVVDVFDFCVRPHEYVSWLSRKTRYNTRKTKKAQSLQGQTMGIGAFDIDYPYAYLKRYLHMRKAYHLEDFVYWCGFAERKGDRECRSKIFINILKHRIRASRNMELIRDMVRNEGHARLLSSLWYVLRFSINIMILVNVVFALTLVGELSFWEKKRDLFQTKQECVVRNNNDRGNEESHIGFQRIMTFKKENNEIPALKYKSACGYVALNVLMLSILWTLKRCSETGFNYVRLRELVMTIESAHILQQEAKLFGLESGPFDDIKGLARCFSKKNCRQKCRKCESQYWVRLNEKVNRQGESYVP